MRYTRHTRHRCIAALAAPVLFISCKKDDDNTPDNNNNNNGSNGSGPIASAEHDADAGGIYKGIVTGSSGYVVIHFKNKDGLVYALLKFDDVSDSLVCPSLNNYTFPGSEINNAIFTSALGTKDSIIFSVKADGSNPSIIVKIPGHETKATIKKETSKSELKVYKGKGYDTLVAGYYQCNGGPKVTTLGSVRPYEITIMVQGDVAVALPSRFTDCPQNDVPDAVVLQIKNGIIEFPDPGPPYKNGKFTVTEEEVSGTIVCTKPIDLGGEIDGYNSYIKATRVKQ